MAEAFANAFDELEASGAMESSHPREAFRRPSHGFRR